MKQIIFNISVILLLASCAGGATTANQEHEHDETIQLCAYSGLFELFAEATPFIVGQESEILAHFTFLNNYKPLDGGVITVNLVVGEQSVSQILDKPTKAGIYKFALTPTTEGAGKIVFDIETPQGKSQIIVPNIVVYTDIHIAHEKAAEIAVTSSSGVVFTKEQSWKVDFATDTARREPFGQLIRTTAQILPSQGDQRVVAAKTGGIVMFSGQNIVEGKSVNAGQVLFSIESGGMADNNLSVRYSEAMAEYNRSKWEYDRKSELAKDRIITQSELLASETQYLNAQAVYNNLRSNFSSGKQSVSSPIGGFVTQILVNNGEYVEAGKAVLAVSQNRNLLIKADLQSKYYPLLSGITSANIRLLNSDVRYTLEELGGKVVSYGKSADAESPLIPVVFQVNNSVGLLSGSFVEMFIKTRTSDQAITIPNDAIFEQMGNYFVFVQLTPELFEKRPVHKGVTDGYRTQIIDGVDAGDRVVSRGATLVSLVQSSGALDAHSGHVH